MDGSGPELVSGGMILGAENPAISRGKTYELYDRSGTLSSIYTIQNQFLNGNTIATDPFSPRFTSNFPADTGYTKKQLETIHPSNSAKRDVLSMPSGLQATVNAAIQTPNGRMQRRVVTQAGVKIGVKKEGMYRVTRAELQAAGFDVNSNSANWRLFADGNEQAIIIGAGDQYIEFYGKGLDVRETDTRTYYLIADSLPGKRAISKILNNIGGNVFSHSYRLSVEKKEREPPSGLSYYALNYSSFLKNGDVENYFGRVVYSDVPTCANPDQPCTFIDLNGIDVNGLLSPTITVKMQGLHRTPATVQHNVRVILNDAELGLVTGYGDTNFSGDLSVPAGLLIEGRNVLKLATSVSSDSLFFDSVKISYNRKYQADNNRILFFTPGYRKIDVNGFSSSAIRVFDVTLDGNPQLVSDLPVTQNGSTFSVRTPSNRPAVMYAVTDAGLLTVDSILPDDASSLATPNNVADMIIISYSSTEFMAAAETWATYRRSPAGGGFTVKVVNVDDIYDEFSYGKHSGAAVHQFLNYAKTNWQDPKPRYVLILGDASTDPRNYERHGTFDFVPTRIPELIYEEAGSDEALSDFNHDGVADMAIGRVPARTVADVTTVFNKTTAFEVPEIQSLSRGFLCASDLPQGFDFAAMCGVLKDQLPSNTPTQLINRGDPQARQTLLDGLNTGKFLVNYSGHGSAGVWANSGFFSVLDVPLLTNANRQSIFTMLTCWNGLFTHPKNDSLGEALLESPTGGAAATWASSTETTPDYQLTMGARFNNQIGLGNIKRIGDLVGDAKATVAGSDVGYSWVLLGDPALKVRP